MRILSLVKKNNYVTVALDTDEKLRLHYEVVVKCGLRKNDELSDQQLKSILDTEKEFNLKNSALLLLSRRLHSSFELQTKLMKKGHTKEEIKPILDDFKNKGYLSDKEFAERFIEEGLKKKKGLMKIKADLFSKGVSRNIIDELIQNYEGDSNLLPNAKALAIKKLDSLKRKKLEPFQKKQKLYSYLSGKGYSSDIIRQIVDELLNDSED
ncbi:MAG: recombination regulator RecX [Melioribacteraceae bacterium]|nr:recombination regulator RecX [Melioribacteraceae bacterium]